jgi:GNAT superfamily N-acetyltransferase
VKIRTGSVQEAVELAKRIPDFSNPYNLDDPETPLPKLDHVLIAEHAGIPVGFRAGYRYSSDTFAVWLAGVLPGYRQRGIGGALYRDQKAWLKSQGYRFLRTHVRNSNRVMLKILVDKGYHAVDIVRYGDVGRNKIVFVKNLWEQDARMNAGGLIVGLLKGSGQDRDLDSWIRDITISWLRFKYSGRIIEDASVDAILDRACASGHRHCLILAHGTIVSHAWELGLVQTLEAWADGREVLVAGRILRHEGSHCGIAAQGLLVDLESYARLSRPAYGEPGTSPVEVAIPAASPAGRGEEEVEPTLQPSGRRALREPGRPGWNLVGASLAAGIPVYSLPEAIAATFLNIAPECGRQADGLKGVRGWAIATRELDPGALSPDQLRFLTGVQRQVRNSRRGIFVWNFESYEDVDEPPADFRPPVSTLFSVAAGLKTNWILQTHGFDEETKLVYFDYSEQALTFKKFLHDEWDGEDYPEFLRHLFKKLPPGEAFYQLWGGFSPEDIGWDAVREAWARELTRWGGAGVIKENWRRVRGLRVDYVLCDILEDQGSLVNRMDGCPNPVIWWTNVFFTFFSNWLHTIESRRRIYEGFIRRLTERNPDVLIYGSDYNNIAIKGVRAAQYSAVYFQADEDELEPRRIRG